MSITGGFNVPPDKCVAFLSAMIEKKNLETLIDFKKQNPGINADDIFYSVRTVENEQTELKDIVIQRIIIDLSGDKPMLVCALPDFIMVSSKVMVIAEAYKKEDYATIIKELAGEELSMEDITGQLQNFMNGNQ